MFFKREKKPELLRLYQALKKAHHEVLTGGVTTDRNTRYVAYSRGCGGGPSFLIREETADGACTAYAILALYEESGIEKSSFATPADALAFVATAVKELRRGR